jgi:mannose-1-phosphate guanylyltransferase
MPDEIVSKCGALGGALVLCAGYGTRLRPLTDERPKALLPVGDRSVLATICERLAAFGLKRAVVNTHHLEAEFRNDISGLGVEIEVSPEPEILGTAGGIAHARRHFGPGPVLVWNGDILCSPSPQTRASMVSKASVPTSVAEAAVGACLLYERRPAGEGNVGIGPGSQGLVRLRGECFGDEICGGDYVGISVLSPESVAQMPSPGCLVGDHLLPWLRNGGRLAAESLAGGWAETGGLKSYLRANMAWLEARAISEWRGEGAAVGSGVRLQNSIVGAGARVRGTGTLDNCVVWPGAQATAPLSGAIVTPRAVVPVVS